MGGVMDIDILFSESAFKHSISEFDICHSLNTPILEEPFEEDDSKVLALGFDHTGNLLEIVYHVIDKAQVRVFHAMKCRHSLMKLIK
jgi:hypothetical protein